MTLIQGENAQNIPSHKFQPCTVFVTVPGFKSVYQENITKMYINSQKQNYDVHKLF